MRDHIHPEYREVLFHDTNANAFFVIGSTLNSDQTREHEGKIYPYVSLDISSASHPFYTGEQRQTSNEGRVANFNKRFARFNRSH
ncbi:type B 50S ribosomal protein L31 [Acinetobacter wanghuae]|uniref:Large ribosomal subunit protein bL31B n=1 Tax=Acinetobacter wanghuae TaxID=2662362 RepID=A0A5Q0P5D2_9GAMM|nr:type B 50S ribosomal protein L31 [Acinetobacter wanghuae]MQW92409.1 type B 50S ribosomal protein L31 [Acinetobacter wanghuae]QGA11954.1 type B 50S ribosomal protein L31 [Acinetobacter wanghuae]